MFDGLLVGILLHQFACWLGDGRKQEVLWVKIMVVSERLTVYIQTADHQYSLVLVGCAHTT